MYRWIACDVYYLNRYNGASTVHQRVTKMNENAINTDRKRDIWYRSGAAARLAGLPVETLRVWERRYGLSETERSSHGQRLYSEEQVKRLGLLKLLVDQGHSIGQLAQLPLARLRELGGARAPAVSDTAAPVRLGVVGMSLARRVAAGADPRELALAANWASLEQAGAVSAPMHLDVLVVELSELHEGVIAGIAAAGRTVHAAAIMVLYRFSASATIRALRAHGWLVARVPAEIGELASLCRAALAGEGLRPQLREPELSAPRRFNDEALVELSAASNRLACECPRHLAELLLMVGSFERYSGQCASRNEADRKLHRDLEDAAGRARVVLEEALERLARAEGIALPPG